MRPIARSFGALLALVASTVAYAGSLSLSWAEAFAVTAAPLGVHFVGHYMDGNGATHRLEVWRHGDAFLHRRTDDAIDLYRVTNETGHDIDFRLLDHRRAIAADVTRTNLYRIGVHSDHFGLAHVLDVPKGAYRIDRTDKPSGVAAADCSWRALVRENATPARTLVCWSARWGLPLVIVAGDAAPQVLFRVDRVEAHSVPIFARGLPEIPSGYAIVNVNEEANAAAD